MKWLLAALLLFGAAVHLRFFAHAGGLWRDEAEQIRTALLPLWADVRQSARFGPSPLLPPLFFRLWAGTFGSSDRSLRAAGLLIGLSTLLLVATSLASVNAGGAPVATALFVFSPFVVPEADALKAYGLGMAFTVGAFFAIWKLTNRPSLGSFLIAAGLSLASVKSMYSNALFLASMLLAAAGVAARHGRRRHLYPLAGVGLLAAAALTPYIHAVRSYGEWRSSLLQPFGFRVLWGVLSHAFSFGPAASWMLWPLLSAALLYGAFRRRPGREGTDRLIYGLGSAGLALALQFFFIRSAVFYPYERYFVVPLALCAAGIGLAWPTRAPPRLAAAVALLLSLAGAGATWSRAAEKRTNIDAIAAELHRAADKKDLIVLARWYFFPSFERYYRGQARWITSPKMEVLPYYRHNIVGELMKDSGAMEGTLAEIREAWKRGGRVWVVGNPPARLEIQEPAGFAPNDVTRANYVWDQRLFRFLFSRGRAVEARPRREEPVYRLEHLRLMAWAKKVPAAPRRPIPSRP